MHRTHLLPAQLVASGVTILALLMSGCSGGDDTAAPRSTSQEDSSGDGPESTREGTEQDRMDWHLAFASCMRENGIDMPDPTEGGAVAGIDPDRTDMAAFEAASETCLGELGEPPVFEGRSEEEVRDSQLEMATCLREHGLDVKDPAPGEGMAVPDVTPEIAEACGLGASTSAQ